MNKNNIKNDEKTLSFALLITKVDVPDGKARFNITSKNQGISDAEVIIFVESWLEKVKDNLKNNIKNNIQLGSDNDVK